MRQVLWSKLASEDLDVLVSYIAEESEQNATRVGDRIEQTAKNLGDSAIGHFGRVQDTYEIVVHRTHYIISYDKTETSINILRVIHGSREWKEGEWPVDG